MEFNEKLRKLRKEKGLSQEELADIIGVSRQALSKWESGSSYPEMEKLIALSGLFGVTIDSLVKDSDLKKDEENEASPPYWTYRGLYYEYKSKRTLFGLPLVHVNIGRGLKRAKGIIAVGNIATGVVSVGMFSRGFLSFGVLSLGLLSLGAFSAGLLLAVGAIALGVVSFGAVALGVFTCGALSIGMFSFGACSIASHIAVGDYAQGHIAIGRIAHGTKAFVDSSPNHDFSLIKADEVKQAIHAEFPNLWNWIGNLIASFFS